MAALTPEIKTFIVQALACFDSPSQVAEAVRANFGLIVSRQLVETNDPTKRCSKGLARRWVTLFEDTRAGFRDAMVEIPIANRAYRLRVLDRMAADAEASGNLVRAAKILEQAARECGDLYVQPAPGLDSTRRSSTHRVRPDYDAEADYTLGPSTPA